MVKEFAEQKEILLGTSSGKVIFIEIKEKSFCYKSHFLFDSEITDIVT